MQNLENAVLNVMAIDFLKERKCPLDEKTRIILFQIKKQQTCVMYVIDSQLLQIFTRHIKE